MKDITKKHIAIYELFKQQFLTFAISCISNYRLAYEESWILNCNMAANKRRNFIVVCYFLANQRTYVRRTWQWNLTRTDKHFFFSSLCCEHVSLM